jgi:hypothetical protein
MPALRVEELGIGFVADSKQCRCAHGEDRGSGWVDATTESKKRVQARLAELESILTETGSAMVSKPVTETISPDIGIKSDTTIKKVVAASSPRGEMGQKALSTLSPKTNLSLVGVQAGR